MRGGSSHLQDVEENIVTALSRGSASEQTPNGLYNVVRSSKARRGSILRHPSYVYPVPPDGGVWAWTVITMAHLVSFNTWGYANSFGVFQTYYVTTLGYPRSNMSWIGSLQIFLLFFLGAFSGHAADMEHLHLIILAGSILSILGIMITSVAREYWHFVVAQGILTGCGNGLLLCPVLAVASTYFSKRRSLALGIVACGSATGGLVYPAVFRQLQPKIGFAWTVRLMGFIMTSTLIPVNLLTRPRILPRGKGSFLDWAAVQELPFALFLIGIFLNILGLYFAYFYLPLYGQQVLHMDQNFASLLLIITNATGIPGRLIPNYLADRFSPLTVLTPYAAACSIAMFSWIAVSDRGGLTVFAVIYGLASAGCQSLLATTVASLSPDERRRGVRMGLVFTTISFAALAGSPIGGLLVQHDGGKYTEAQIFVGIVLMAGCVILFTANTAQKRAQ